MQRKFDILITATAKGFQDTVRKTSGEIRTSFKKSRLAVKAFNETVENGTRALGSLSGSLKAVLAGAGVQRIISGLFQAGVEGQKLTRSFEAIKGSGKAASAELAFLRAVTEKLGLEFYSTAGAYKGILAAAEGTELQGEQTRRIFSAMTEASAALGLSAEETAGALRAMEQMISKGNVQAEELRGQLGERLPGAFQLAAQAMGVSTEELNKMLDRGEVLATELLPRLADILHEKYGKAAEEASDDAVKALNRFRTAWMDIKMQIAESGFLDAAAQALKNMSQAFKDPALISSLKDFGQILGNAIQAIVNFAIEWRKLLAALLATYAAVKTISFLANAVMGLNAAFKVMTGTGILSWLGNLRTAIIGVASSATLAGTAMKAGLAAGAAWGAVEIGQAVKAFMEWRRAAKDAGEAQDRLRDNASRLMRKYEEFKDVKLPADITGLAQEDLEKLKEKLVSARVYYTALKNDLEARAEEKTALGFYTDEALEAQKQLTEVNARLGEIQAGLDKVGEAASGAADAMKKPADAVLATKEQLKEFEKQAKRAYEEAKKQAEDYAKKAVEWEEKIKYARLSTEDKIRELGRKGLGEELAWKDKLYQAEEKLFAAREALRKGDFELAEKLAKQSEDLYADLAVEVKKTEGGKDVVVKSLEETKRIAVDGVTEVGRFIEELYAQQKAAAETASAQWSKTADGIKEQLDEIAKEREAKVKIQLTNLEAAQKAINALIKDETKYINVVVRRTGAAQKEYGLGGRIPGYGGGDRIRALLEAGEYVIRKEAVQKYGAALFDALNAGRLALPGLSSMVKARIGGLIANVSIPELPEANRFGFREGGLARAVASSAGETMTIRFQAGNAEMPLKVQGPPSMTRSMVKEFERELIKMGLAK